jgi:anthranilate 1,2-dioxygenase small subunit
MALAAPAPMAILSAVMDLQAAHAELIDDDRLEEWPDLFVEDCIYKVISRENADRGLEVATMFCTSRAMLADRVVSLRQANVFPVHHYRHILSTPRIHSIEDEVIEAQTNYVVLQTRNDGSTQIFNAGKYLDRIRLRGDRFQFVSKIAIFDTNRIDTLMVKPI